MIYKNNRDTAGVYCGSMEIERVYHGHKLVWSKFLETLSCYFNGYWIDEYPWTDDTPWKD